MSRKNIEGYINWLGRIRAGQKKVTAVVLVMAVAVSGNVFWALRASGSALADKPLCGLEEHNHTDECYEKVLVCDEDHEHTDECYEDRLICEQEEHSHTDKCYIDISAHEKASDWEKTIPELTGVKAADLIKVAVSQTGYKEGEDGYSRYGDWYGNPDADWNVMFVSFCLNYAGISKTDIPYGSGCWAWQVKLGEKDLLKTDMSEGLLPGDILMIDSDGDGKCDRASIVIDITDNIISVAEGDVDGKVDVVTYKDDDKSLFGFVSVNALDAAEESDIDNTEDPEDPETTETTEEDTGLAAAEFDAETSSGIKVHVTAPEGAFPEGTVMSASDVNDKSVIAKAEGAVDEDKEVKGSIAVDITFTDSEGNEIEPADGMTVDVNITIPKDKQLTADDYQLFHVDDNGIQEVKDAQVSKSEAVFTADGFSIFVVTGTGEKDKDRIHAWLIAAGMGEMHEYRTDGGEGDNIINCRDYPYMMEEGDTVILRGYVDDGQTHHIVNWGNFDFSDVIRIEELQNDANGVVARITALSATENAGAPCRDGEAAVSLSGTDESFSIQVISRKENTHVIDFDDLPKYNADDASTLHTVHVNFQDSITFKGTPNRTEADFDWPYMVTSENPEVRLLSAFSGHTTDGSGVRSVNCTVDGYQKYESDNAQIVTFFTNKGFKKVRIIIDQPFRTFGNNYWELIDHADIEIAEGGVYTSVSFDIGDDDGLIKTVTTFQSYVCNVNTCMLYQQDGSPVPFFEKHLDTDGWSTLDIFRTNEQGFVTEDYWHDPAFVPGDSQYELTSKYVKNAAGDLIFSDKFFLYRDVDHVTFDVGLQIVPTKVEKYRKDGADWVLIADEIETYVPDYEAKKYDKWIGDNRVVYDGDLTEIMETDDSVIFKLDKRYVIDAYNKCPNHSGLDFMVHANTASVKFGATKELTNGVLRGDDFTFELVDTDRNVVVSRTNDANGKVVFDRISYETPGTHHYIIREVDESADHPNIAYDDSIYNVTVVVEEVEGTGGMLMANVSEFNDNYSFKFTNMVMVALPDTGGTGVIPIMAAGALMIGTAGALILLMLRRRKEVDL